MSSGDIEQIDLTADNSLSTFDCLATSTTPTVPIETTTSVYGTVNYAMPTPPRRTAYNTAQSTIRVRRQAVPAASGGTFDDGFHDVDTISILPEPEPRSSMRSVQPAPCFRLPGATPSPYELASFANSRASYEQRSNIDTFAPTPPAKRKRSDQVPIFRTPSRSNSLHNSNSEGLDFRGWNDTVLTPPATTHSRTRMLDLSSPTPTCSDLDAPALNSLTTTIEGLAQSITNLHQQYQKPMVELAHKVNSLTDHLIEVEAENGRLREHIESTFTRFAWQTSESVRGLDERCAEVIHASDEVLAQYRSVAGGAYGGPASTQPNRQPGHFTNMLLNGGSN
ncbi:hypothetical protein LTR08_002811 [Meristemomyces frigidus]|nr:hypothetical protein LTR08_002811 [Meristemomyces frigidus]